ncbi:MAG: TlpA family protein disulfide reductase [Bacteroidales bacterium]|jgi:thiol-disulfide isomerase/thioredoxin|nr:TlpA family protein disulfide reductase [Bacteroidales bacterium]
MHTFFVIILLLAGGISSLTAQEITRIGVTELDELLVNPTDELHVVNFWATWCPPCVTELPYFEKLSKEYEGKGVKFILISLDFPSQIESRLIPFLETNKITADVKVMTNIDYNSWIEKIDQGWQGNIPVTLFFNNAKEIRYFHPEELEEDKLRELIIKYLR